MASVKSNVILNGINSLTSIAYPVITFPYAARVLLPEGIGAVSFFNSIIGYIVLLTSLGIPMYAVREVAKYRDDKEKRDRITLEILALSFVLCLLGYVAVWILATFVPEIHSRSGLFYVLSLSIVFTTIGVNWFYQGIEDFKFVTIRAVLVRTLAAVSLFIFVKDSGDLLIYGVIVVGSTVGNNFINFVHLRKHVDFGLFSLRRLGIKRHVKPALEIFALSLIISLYLQLNMVMLGFMSGDEQVGFYTAGTKIPGIALTVITSLGTVLLPRCSNLIQNGNREEFSTLINKSLGVTLALSLPLMVGGMALAEPLIRVFGGEEFLPSVPVLYLNAPVIVFISLSNLTSMQILYPMDRIGIVISGVSAGAISNVILNIILIPGFGAIGAAVATLVAEFAVIAVEIVRGKKYFPFKFRDIFQPSYIIASMVMGGSVAAWSMIMESDAWKLAGGLTIGFIVYAGMLYLMKDNLFLELAGDIKRKLRR